jgi:hypothetical protein
MRTGGQDGRSLWYNTPSLIPYKCILHWHARNHGKPYHMPTIFDNQPDISIGTIIHYAPPPHHPAPS